MESGYTSSSSTDGLEPAKPRPKHQTPLAKVVAAESAKRGPSDRFRRERESYYAHLPASDLVRRLIAEEYESKKSKKMLDSALTQLDSFSRHYYSSEAEQKTDFTQLQQLIAAQQEGIAAKQQVELYKMQLEIAQAEILRAQRILDMVEKQRDEAEEAAARARAKARKLNEEKVSTVARDNGRREGFEDGLRAGRLEAERAIRAEEEEMWRQERQRQIEYGQSPARSAYIEEEMDDDDEEPLPIPTPRAGRGVTVEEEEDEHHSNVRPPTNSSARRSHLGRARGAQDTSRRSISSAGTSSPSVSVRRRTTSLESSFHDGRNAHPLQQSSSAGPSSSTPKVSARQREKQPEEPVVPFMPGLEVEPVVQPPPPDPVTPTQAHPAPSLPVPQIQVPIRPPSILHSRAPLGHFPMPPPPVDAQYLGSSNSNQMPTPIIPVGDALRSVRASQRPTERMPTASVPHDDELRGIRARKDGQIPEARLPTSASDLAKIRVTSSRHTSEGSMPTPTVPSGEDLRHIRASSRNGGLSMMPSITIPNSPEDLARIRANKDGGGMPTPTVPSGEQLRHIRASSTVGYREGQMPTPTVPTGDDLRNIRANGYRDGQMPTPTVPTGDDLRNIRVTSSRDGQMPTPIIPTVDDLCNIRANSSREGQMPTPSVPTGEDLRNIRAGGTSSRAGRMPAASVPTGDELSNIRVTSRSGHREGQMPTASVPSGDELRNIRASQGGQMPTPTIPTSGDLRNIRASTKGGRMPTPSIPSGDQLRDIRTSSKGSGSRMPSANVPQGADALQSIRAHQSSLYAEPGMTMPSASVPTDTELRNVSSRSASGGAMPVASVPSGDALRHVRAHSTSSASTPQRTSRSTTDPSNRAATGTPAYGRLNGKGVYSPGDLYGNSAELPPRRHASNPGHGYSTSSSAGGGHQRRPSSPESMSSVGTAASIGLVSFPSAEPYQEKHHRNSRGLSVIPEGGTEYGSSRGSTMSNRRASEEERVRRELQTEQDRRKREAERQLQAERKASEMNQWARTREAAAALAMSTESRGGANASGNVEEWRRSTSGGHSGSNQPVYPATSYGSNRAPSQQPVEPVYPSSSYGAASTAAGTNPWASGLLSPGASKPHLSRQSSVSSSTINIDVQSPSNPPSEVDENNPGHPSDQYLSPNPSHRPLPQGQPPRHSRQGNGRNSVSVPTTGQIVHVSPTDDAPLPPGFVPTTPLMRHGSPNMTTSPVLPFETPTGSPSPVIPSLPPGFVPDGSTTPRAGQSPLPGFSDLPPGFIPTSPLPTGEGLGISGSSPLMRSSSMSNQPSPRFAGVGLGRPSSGMGNRSPAFGSGRPVVPMTPSQTYVAVPSPPTTNRFGFGGANSPFSGGQDPPGAGGSSNEPISASVSPSQFAKALAGESGMKVTGAKGKKKKGKK